MNSLKGWRTKLVLCAFVLLFSTGLAFAQEGAGAGTVNGRLLKASYTGIDTTNLYEPLVTISESETLGVRYLSLELVGARPRNNKKYEFYNDGTANSPLVWKRRMRGVVVEPINVYIAVTEGVNNTNHLLISYEYIDSQGFGTVSYIVALEK
ncbi:MAG: hypothetical protein Ta2F_09620 [Termitinemataceae bacterium]|nr:MAG: hypothetical protein Ta2F_09620 [Termitinemataceae bacterium]